MKQTDYTSWIIVGDTRAIIKIEDWEPRAGDAMKEIMRRLKNG